MIPTRYSPVRRLWPSTAPPPDGHDYTALARQRGASCAISTHPVEGLPYVIVPAHPGRPWARIAGNFFRHPDRELHLIGVTGTNGKTSVAWLTAGMLQALGIRTGLMGTNGLPHRGHGPPLPPHHPRILGGAASAAANGRFRVHLRGDGGILPRIGT